MSAFLLRLKANYLEQEIIKLRECIPHIGLIPKVIPLKLFLVMILSSSEDWLLALCVDSRSDFLETTSDEMVGTSLYMF